MANPKTIVTINGYTPDGSVIQTGTSRVTAFVRVNMGTWTGESKGIYFALTAYDEESTKYTWYWTSHSKSSLSIDITNYTRLYEGWQFTVNASVITRYPTYTSGTEKEFTGSTESPSNYNMRTISPVSGIFYINGGGSGQDLFRSYLIYPYIKDSKFLGGPRKIIFKATYYGRSPGVIQDAVISYYANNTYKEYNYSNISYKSRFEFRVHDSEWQTFNPSVDSVNDGDSIYGVFVTPESGSTVLTDITVNVIRSNTSIESDENSSTAYIKDESLFVFRNDIVSKGSGGTQKGTADYLSNVLTQISNSYQKVRDEFSLESYPTVTLAVASEKISSAPFKELLYYWKSFYISLTNIFPKSFPSNTVLNNMYLPEEGGNELIEANTDTPVSTVNGNFFNNLIWLIKNLL